MVKKWLSLLTQVEYKLHILEVIINTLSRPAKKIMNMYFPKWINQTPENCKLLCAAWKNANSKNLYTWCLACLSSWRLIERINIYNNGVRTCWIVYCIKVTWSCLEFCVWNSTKKYSEGEIEWQFSN